MREHMSLSLPPAVWFYGCTLLYVGVHASNIFTLLIYLNCDLACTNHHTQVAAVGGFKVGGEHELCCMGKSMDGPDE